MEHPAPDSRATLERLVREGRADYAGLSRMLGRNPAYIQQYIKRGSPKRLSDGDRRLLARYFGISETELGGEAVAPAAGEGGLVLIPRFNIGAAAGAGSFGSDELPTAQIGFAPAWLKQISGASPANLSIIRVQGDSMEPTLADGDDIMVDRTDAGARLRDGIHVLRRDDMLVVKRLAVNPATRLVTVTSDNPAYPTWPDCPPAEIDVVGRVVWAARKIS